MKKEAFNTAENSIKSKVEQLLKKHTSNGSLDNSEMQILDQIQDLEELQSDLKHLDKNLTDNTERKIAEQVLVDSEIKLCNLLNNLNIGVVVHAPDTSITFSNSRASALLGLSKKQMAGKQAIDPAWKFLNEANNPIPLNDYPVNRIIASETPIKNMVVGVIRDQTKPLIWLLVNGFPVLDTNNEIVEIVINFVDITERKESEIALYESEEKFKTLVTGSEEIIFMTDKNGIFTLSEGKGLSKLGLKSGEIVGKSVFDLYKDYPEMLDVMRKTLNGIAAELDVKIAKMYFRNWYTPHLNTRGKVVGLMGMSVNITELKLAEEEIKKHREQLEELVKERTMELENKNKELDNALKVFVGRELTIKKLQEKVRLLGGE